ncbi:MAG: hypothetical protein H6Q13_1127 [Bacteroidetes bacterium]|nr:hypothetical protein [Bacteroidota bacterium]
MKKIVFLLLIALCLPLAIMAQSYDDLYFTPKKDDKAAQEEKTSSEQKKKGVTTTTRVYATPATAVVVQDSKGNVRDVDEYNRRYDSSDNDFVMEDDTLYVKEKEQSDLDGEWVSGFNGSEDDYEYAERIIRFRNPRYAISISSPLYWDIVYGTNSWDWNVYTDGMYAYAFPTFTNRLWWDWRYNSFGYGWGYPYYYGGWYSDYWGGYYGSSWYWGWGGYNYYPGYWNGGGGHWANNNRVYTNRRSVGDYSSGGSPRRSSYATGSTARRSYSDGNQSTRTSNRRVVGIRETGERPGITTRTDASSSRRTTYTRPSSTRSRITYEEVGSGTSSSSRRSSSSTYSSTRSNSEGTVRSSSYSRGSSSSTPTRSYSSGESSRRSSYNSGSSSRSYSPSSSSSSSSRGSSSSAGSSSRSSSGSSSGGSSSRGRR